MNLSFVKRAGLAALAAVVVGLVAATPSEARPLRPRPRGFNLYNAPLVGLEVNRVYCGLVGEGNGICSDITGSPVLGGGSWPRGSGSGYIFNSGLQIAGIIPSTATFGGTGRSWAGDTVGAFFFDPKGTEEHTEAVTNIYSSLDPADQGAGWPSAAYYNDATLFNPALLGRATIAQQDVWWRYWDGNMNLVGGRQHPAGILVEQRGLGWNFPSGNEDLIYFITRFINITADGSTAAGRAKYDALLAYGYSAADIDTIAAIGTRFQQTAEAKYNISIPDTGYSIQSMYAAVGMDADISPDFRTNYGSANLPFALGYFYMGNWYYPTWQYPSNIFAPPFAVAPGFVGVKYLKSPLNPNTPNPTDEFGITIWSNTTNSAVFPDASGVQQLYRYLSGSVSTALGDAGCSVPNPQARHVCAAVQVQDDARFFASSGPFSLNPGNSEVFVTAYIFAAGVATAVTPFIRGNMVPGLPIDGARLVSGADTVRNVDRATGWVSHADLDGDLTVEQNEVTVVDRSLLGKALVAQAVFDNGFLLPFAPESPQYFAIPGDDQVTIVWQPSPTEMVGDPYYAIASQPTVVPPGGGPPVANPLYDPNYRGQPGTAPGDVEGYRIWRGRTPSQMEVIAQFDYQSTRFVDQNGSVFNSNYGTQCAPELGLTISCPTFPNNVPIAEQIGLQPGLVQIPPGGRVETQTPGATGGNVIITLADTAVSGGALCQGHRCPSLTDTGVPFSYVDSTARNGFRYYYAVTAFDVNSIKSVGIGYTSLESPLGVTSVTPRASSGQETAGTLATLELLGADGNPLTGTMPTIDATTGIFSGPMPPTNGFDVAFAAFLPEVLQAGDVTVTIDSVVPGSRWTRFRAATYYLTGQGAGAPVKFTMTLGGVDDNTPIANSYPQTTFSNSAPFEATALDSAAASRYGGDQTYSLYANAALQIGGTWGLMMKGRGWVNSDPARGYTSGWSNGWRWWEGSANENTNDPNGINCPSLTAGASFTCTLTGANLLRNVGQIAGVDLFGPMSYFTVASTSPSRDQEAMTSTIFRAADMKVYWGAPGVVDSVVDVTHRVRVPWDSAIRASWGILNVASFAGTNQATTQDANNGLLTWSDVLCVMPSPSYLNRCGGNAQTPALLQNVAVLNPIWFGAGSYAGTAGQVSNGTGFIIYLNGTFTVVRTATLPSNTVWNARFYAGNITGAAGSYAYDGTVAVRPPNVPGLRARISYTGSTFDPNTTTEANLARVHTVPDPYYVTHSLELTPTTKVLRFVNLPMQAIIRIYSTSGVLVNIVSHNDPTGGGEATWNLRNRNNQFVASGVYFYHVETPDGREKIGRFTVVNYAQ